MKCVYFRSNVKANGQVGFWSPAGTSDIIVSPLMSRRYMKMKRKPLVLPMVVFSCLIAYGTGVLAQGMPAGVQEYIAMGRDEQMWRFMQYVATSEPMNCIVS